MSDPNPSRRTLLLAGGAVVAAAAVAAPKLFGPSVTATAAPTSYSFEDSNRCILAATVEEGPFYVDEALVRRDIREDRQGHVTRLRLKVVDAATCAVLPGAAIDVWHCDALGAYSAVSARGLAAANASRFLRGRQIADKDGMVEFVTIFPGWYPGRTPHIHLKAYVGQAQAATTQLFFPAPLIQTVYAGTPYARRGLPRTGNDNDGVLAAARGADGAWPKIARAGDALSATLTLGIARPS